MLDSNSLEYLLKQLEDKFKENAKIINPFYRFLVLIVFVGGPLSALFVLLLAYASPNTTTLIYVIIFVSLVVGFKLGPSPFFVVNCSWIYFRFHKLGVWLPLTAYLIALTILGLQIIANKVLTQSNE